MKSIQLKAIFIITIAASMFAGCTKDSDVEYPVPANILLSEKFDNPNVAPYTLVAQGWTSYAEQGTKLWLNKSYSGDGYAIFTSFSSGQPVNTAWLISPEVDMDNQESEKLTFQTCQDGFIKNADNSLELFVSTDYDGTNFAAASWDKVSFNVATPNTEKFLYVNSGIINLSSYKGKLHFAFKMKGTTSLSGGYQIDNVKLFY
ncbi:choice-of-anchor J domain-containing protein [Flavobacterium sp.]|uniref:choice-of-anchor J domain-containing protein n=1 Tax=Flavobacterium sp. TaxID=239 RepID=UPI0038FCAFFC